MKILIIEDNIRILDILETHLAKNNFVIDTAVDGTDGFEKAKKNTYDLIILDLMLPNRSGFEIITGLRALEIKYPILVISALDRVKDRVKALNLGADDYLVKSFSFEELIARSKTLIRRSSGRTNNIFRCKNLLVDITNTIVRRNGKMLFITQTEFRILEILIRKKNKVVLSEDLLKTVWGEKALKLNSNKLNVHLRLLRKKVDDSYNVKLIKTIRGFGYMMTDLG